MFSYANDSPYRTDLAVYSHTGELALLVEVKGRSGTSDEWAIHLLRNMYAHGDLPPVPYFLLILPERLYLWRDVKPEMLSGDIRVFIAEATPIFAPYFERMRAMTGTAPTPALLGRSLEMMVASWLEEIVNPDRPLPHHTFSWLQQSRLADAIRGGKVELETLL